MSDVYLIPRLNFLPKIGSFAKLSGDYQGQWYICREEFHWVNANTRRFLFVHETNAGSNIASFIEKVENKLKVDVRSVFTPTQYNRITLVCMSPWWKHSIRRSLFTALLRVGQYYKGGFHKPLFSEIYGKENYYTRDTEPAVRWFLRGNTRYLGHVQGWWEAFYGSQGYAPITKSELEKLLVKPE